MKMKKTKLEVLMRMWKRAIAVTMTACICLLTPVHTYAQAEKKEVVTVTANDNTIADNTKEATEIQNKTNNTSAETTSSKVKTSSVKASSVRKASKKKTTKKYLGTFKAYAYNGSGTTASGTKTKANRTVAVDPSVIPLGSKLIINGKTYVAEDTGGFIKGKKIDIYMPSYDDCIQWGVRNVKVYLVK